MRRRPATIAVVVLLAVAGCSTSSEPAGAPSGTPTAAPSSSSPSAGPTTPAVTAQTRYLQAQVQRERLARDLYAALAAKHGLRVLERTGAAEERHRAQVAALLAARGLADPSSGMPAGRYADPALQRLYDDWLAEGLRDAAHATQVGVHVEEHVIAALSDGLRAATSADVRAVTSNLIEASRNHLAAFESQGAPS